MNEFYYLSHGGPGSGRYPLGSGERPYQKFERSGRGRFSISGYIQSRKDKKKEANIKKSIDQKLEEERRKKKMAQNKEKVLRSGTASDVLKYQGQLTNQELQNVVTRLNLESQLRGMSQKDVKTTMDKVDSVMKNVKIGTDWVKTSIDAYNAFAAVYNATENGKKNPLTFIKKGGDGREKKKK